jgi:hypothetical protein
LLGTNQNTAFFVIRQRANNHRLTAARNRPGSYTVMIAPGDGQRVALLEIYASPT